MEQSRNFETNYQIHTFTGGFTQTNGYAFEGPGGWIGVDAPEGFAAWLKSKNIRLSALLLSHAHFDHVVDAAEIAINHGCQVYAWEKSTPETRLEDFLLRMAGISIVIQDYPLHVALKGMESIQVCGIDFDLAHVPGHSPDSVVFFDKLHRQLFSGDTLMAGTMGRTDFPGGGTQMLISGIRTKLLPLGDDVTVWSGHGEATTIGKERAWVERGRF